MKQETLEAAEQISESLAGLKGMLCGYNDCWVGIVKGTWILNRHTTHPIPQHLAKEFDKLLNTWIQDKITILEKQLESL